MRRKREQELPVEIARVRERFTFWRESREKLSPIPEELWKSAVQLTQSFSVHRIARALHLDYNALKKRVDPQKKRSGAKRESRPLFWEMEAGSISTTSAECVVEMQDARGATLKIQMKGKGDLDLLALSQCFLRGES